MPDDSRILVTKPLPRGHCLSFQPFLCGYSPRVGILNILSCPGSSSIAKTPEILHYLKLWCHKAGKPAQLMQDARGCPHPHPCSPSHHPGHPASSFFLLIVFPFLCQIITLLWSFPCFESRRARSAFSCWQTDMEWGQGSHLPSPRRSDTLPVTSTG